jgi:hypothetical protein
MRNKWYLLFALLLALGLLLTACGGGGDDDDVAADDDNDDNDDADDDDDDNDDNDDNNDDNDDNDTDVEYDPITCTLPDPESLGDGVTVGGGPISGTITAYVFDDFTCAPLASGAATVNGQPTDADGKVVLTTDKAAELVVAMAPDHWSWAYKLDAAIMYFRLRGDATGTWSDSDPADFLSGGSPLALENPDGNYNIGNLGDLLATPIYLGLAIPGVARSNVLSLDFDHFFSETTFPLNYTYQVIGDDPVTDVVDLPANIYFPLLDISVNLIGIASAEADGENAQYVIPVNSDQDVNPIEGIVLSATISEALSADALINIILTLIGGGDIMEVILGIIEPVINDALVFEYQAVDPEWDGTGAPDLDAVDIVSAKETIDLTIANDEAGFDYLGLLAGEIPNRALWPMGMALAVDGAASFAAASVPNADYALLVAKTNVLDAIVSGDPIVLSFALRFAENLSEWAGGVALDDNTDFLPVFAETTEYAGGVVTWDLAGDKAAIDAYVVIASPDVGETGIALVPGTESSFDAAGTFDYTPADADVIALIGIDLPDGVDINEFDPTSLIGYNSTAINIWTNADLSGIIPTN